jgi:hypothetical protein
MDCDAISLNKLCPPQNNIKIFLWPFEISFRYSRRWNALQTGSLY